MAVTLTLGELANQVRISTTASTSDVPDEYNTILSTNLAAATALVESRAPAAPDEVAKQGRRADSWAYWLEAPPACIGPTVRLQRLAS